MPSPVSANFSIYLLPWLLDQAFWDCKISYELLLPLEELQMCKEQKSRTARWNLAVGLVSNRNVTQTCRVSVPRLGSVAHTSPFTHLLCAW